QQQPAADPAWHEGDLVALPPRLRDASLSFMRSGGTLHAIGVFLLFAGCLPAQTGATATALGTISDASGGVIAGALVTAINAETRLSRSATSDNEGNYTIFSLPIGRYDIRAEARGFRTAERKDVVLTIDQRARVDFQLTVGQTSETVTITGETPTVKTEDSSTSQVITQRAVVDLPLNGRNFMQLSRLT